MSSDNSSLPSLSRGPSPLSSERSLPLHPANPRRRAHVSSSGGSDRSDGHRRTRRRFRSPSTRSTSGHSSYIGRPGTPTCPDTATWAHYLDYLLRQYDDIHIDNAPIAILEYDDLKPHEDLMKCFVDSFKLCTNALRAQRDIRGRALSRDREVSSRHPSRAGSSNRHSDRPDDSSATGGSTSWTLNHESLRSCLKGLSCMLTVDDR